MSKQVHITKMLRDLADHLEAQQLAEHDLDGLMAIVIDLVQKASAVSLKHQSATRTRLSGATPIPAEPVGGAARRDSNK